MFGGLIVTDKILLYLHPKMIPYGIFASIILFVLGVVQFFQWLKAKQVAKITIGHALFSFPILLLLVVAPQELSAEIAQSKGAYVVSESMSIGVEKKTVSDTLIEGGDSKGNEDIDYSGYVFEKTVMQFFRDPADLIDETIILKGVVASYNDDDDLTFLLGRLVITCCAADAQILGFKSHWEDAATLEVGKWVEVEGIIRETGVDDGVSFNSNATHVLEVIKIEYTEVPDNPYIYP